ncbi:acylneuraminate cytidylyltransferase family protein [Brevibacillus sp. AY1]|uniref:acylneuraminate cytidylyltransferase family protein n=1 Tax=Brevibacillus sp. AY1 TaxID=2807621 RepID=UPI0024571A46|nr:acylneuraminate cytidylyltransferase family protein [Brevibacillus sp. AY1]MDH4618266.1 acylneuraminate cytidylyltransferase family protein [Brevibacillus sp. AY1]
MKRICTICARGGSKGVKNKNIRHILNKPLIAFSIRQAKLSGIFEYIAVSSDSEEILNVAREYGADFLIKRPNEMATDESAKLPAIQHCVQEVEKRLNITFETIVDLDATSPLRTIEDIQGAVTLLEGQICSNVITAAPSRRSPYFNLVERNKYGYVMLSKELDGGIARRQDSPKCYDMNASIYVWKRNTFYEAKTIIQKDTLLYEMPEDRSIDIDSELDFMFVDFLITQKRDSYEKLFL